MKKIRPIFTILLICIIIQSPRQLYFTILPVEQPMGWHSIIWNGTNQFGEQVPAGLYLSKITSGNEVKTNKLMLLK